MTTKYYAHGIGHIQKHDTGYLVSFYGRRVCQQIVSTIAEARVALAALAKNGGAA